MRFISSKAHTIIGILVGIVLIVAPWLIGFSDEPAPTRVAVIVGAFILVNELITTSPSSPLKVVPMRVHIVIDVLTGIFLAASPWLFGFADLDAEYWVPHLVVGILVAGYALMTNTGDSRDRRDAGSTSTAATR
jgi:hypothetical protein